MLGFIEAINPSPFIAFGQLLASGSDGCLVLVHFALMNT
jgi:hypothetical protein